MQKRKIKDDDNILRIYRVATQKDLEKWEEAKNREIPTLYRAKQIIDEMKMEMKLSDVEFQSDNSKATFYYSADDRVDFRELIKSLASEFKIRVEMRQISLRQEAGRLGGIGVCGRELCCSTWIYDFKSVNTSAARYQNLSLNPTKLSGQCGRLKCCLNYELDTYMAALSDIPEVDKPLHTEAGYAKLQKTDIFRKLMWFSYNNDNNWHSITCERVSEILELNSKGVIPYDLKTNHGKEQEDLISKSNMELEALDKKFSKNKKTKKKKKPRNPGENQLTAKDSSGPEARQITTKPEGKPHRQSPEKTNQNRQNPPRKNVESRPEPIENQEKGAQIPKGVNTEQVPKKKKNNKRRFNSRNKGEQNKGDQNQGQ
jgi:cell fate regulator YaaT (PSP1 superfamily)